MKIYQNKSKKDGLIFIKLKASSTIEMSLIMPMILTIFVFLIYLSFFLYNRVEVTANAYICALRGSRMEQETVKETYQTMKQESDNLMKGSLLAVKEYKEQIKVKGNDIQITYNILQQVPKNLILSNLFYESTWNFQVTKKTKKLQPVFFIRNCRKIENMKNKEDSDK